jgi:hypothetical protein
MTKQELMDEISKCLSIRHFHVSNGSTEPRDFFVAVANQLGFGELVTNQGKVELARLILESVGASWDDSHFSEGSTITKKYFVTLLNAVEDTFKP